MLFTSVPFLLYFLPATLIGYQLIGRHGRRAVIGWLALMSVVFYGYWNPRFVFVLLGSVALNFFSSVMIARSNEPRKRVWLIAAVSANLALLSFFKYLFPSLNFFHQIGWSRHLWSGVILPLGISFFTFTQIAYLVDLSQGEAAPQGFVEYALFVTFFPHLIAGPILHHREMMPQFSEERQYRLQGNDFLVGLSWFILGLAKKAILADRLALVADQDFRHVALLSTGSAWVAILSYSLQLYFDFSGYSDMAIGLARMFSIDFPLNFNSPYKAANMIDFWARWHMTLTRYLTLYLYNPISLGVSRRRFAAGKKVSRAAQKTLAGFSSMVAWPMLATMFLIGIWHGAGLQFLIFGVLHGVFLSANHAWRIFVRAPSASEKVNPFTRTASVLLTYSCVLVGQVFFRANSTADAMTLLSGMAGLGHGALHPSFSSSEVLLLVLFPVVWFMPNTQEMLGQVKPRIEDSSFWARLQYRPTWTWSIAMAVLFLVAILFVSNGSTFLYFQF